MAKFTPKTWLCAEIIDFSRQVPLTRQGFLPLGSSTGISVLPLLSVTIRDLPMDDDLLEAIDFHNTIVTEGGKAFVGYETEKALANMVPKSPPPTTRKRNDRSTLGTFFCEVSPESEKHFSVWFWRPSVVPDSPGCRAEPICSRPRWWDFRWSTPRRVTL